MKYGTKGTKKMAMGGMAGMGAPGMVDPAMAPPGMPPAMPPAMGAPSMGAPGMVPPGMPPPGMAAPGQPMYAKGGGVERKGKTKGKTVKMAKGGSVGKASKRADGVAQRGKTRCKMV